MSWTDPRSPWQRAQRRRLRLAWTSVALVLGLDVVMLVVLAVLSARMAGLTRGIAATTGEDGGVPSLVLIAGAFILLGMLLPMIPIVRYVRRERHVLRAVPACDGLLCPRCRRVLATGDAGGLRCPAGHPLGDAEAVREHWASYPFDPDRRRPAAERSFAETLRRRPLVFVVALLAGWVAFAAVVSRWIGGPLLLTMVKYSWAMLIPLASYLWNRGRGERVGDAVFCAACGYERAPGATGRQCPECGGRWREPGGFVRGQRAGSPAMRWAAVGCGLLVVAVMLLQFPRFKRPLVRAAPTSVLIDTVVGTLGFHQDEWAELVSRALTPAQEQELFEGLLERRRRRDYLFANATAWASGRIAAGAVPPELVERWYAEMLEARLPDPGPLAVGAAVTLPVELHAIPPSITGQSLHVLAEGVWVDGEPQPEPLPRLIQAYFRLEETGDPKRWGMASPPFTVATPGEHEIEVRFWQIVGPAALSGDAVRWDASGEPILPAKVAWAKRVTLKRTVRFAGRPLSKGPDG
ncbi:MAG: hypothetical protein ACYTJ0_03150 [Planctomycetota bacterium]